MKHEELLAHSGFVRSLARSLVLDENTAADIEQQTFLAALEHPPQIHKSLPAWLSKVVRNYVRMMHREETRRQKYKTLTPCAEKAPSPEEVLARGEACRSLIDAVLALDEPYRTAVMRRYYEDLTPLEMAKQMKVPVNTVRTRLHRGLGMLRARLDAAHGNNRDRWSLAFAPIIGLKISASTTVASALSGSSLGGVPLMAVKTKIAAAALLILTGIVGLYLVLENQEAASGDLSNSDASIHTAGLSVDDDSRSSNSAAPGPGVTKNINFNDEDNLKLALDIECASVHGHVIDPNGNPIEGVMIEETWDEKISNRLNSADLLTSSGWTDTGKTTKPDGSFSVIIPKHRLPVTRLRISHRDFINCAVSLIKAIPGHDDDYLINDIRLKPTFFIKGKVVNTKGAPLKDCKVTAPHTPWSHYRFGKAKYVLTDEKGFFRLDIKRNTPLTVTAYKEGLGIGWSKNIIPGQGNKIPELKIIIKQGAPISGRLLDADGTPAEGKRLFAESTVNDCKIHCFAYPDQEGFFIFPSLPMAYYTITTEKIGAPSNKCTLEKVRFHTLTEDVRAGEKNFSLYLPEASKLIVRLKDSMGEIVDIEPNIAFEQSIIAYKNGSTCHFGFNWTGKVKKISPGVFLYNNMQPGVFCLSIEVDGYSRININDVDVPYPPETGELSITLHPIKSISGYLLTTNSKPVNGVAVLTEYIDAFENEECDRIAFNRQGIRCRPNTSPGATVITDKNGFFKNDGIRNGEHMLYFSLNGREVQKEGPISVTDKDPNIEVSITIPSLFGSIKGVVRDGIGNPLSRAVVIAWDGAELFNVTRADEKGAYCFLNLPDGAYKVDARDLSNASLRWNSSRSNKKPKDSFEKLDDKKTFNACIDNGEACLLNLIIPDPWNSSISGKVMIRSKIMPKNMLITLDEFDDSPDDKPYVKPSVADLFEYVSLRNNRENRMGHFRFNDLRSGRYRVLVEWDEPDSGYNGRQFYSRPITLEPSSSQTIDIDLSLTTIEGSCIDKTTGMPVQGARVMLFTNRYQHYIDLDCLEGGAFEGRNIPVGEYVLVVQHPSYGPFIKQPIKLLDNHANINNICEMESGCAVSGIVKLKKGSWSNYRWHVIPEIPPIGAYWNAGGNVDEVGLFTLSGLPKGKLKLSLYKGSNPVKVFNVTLPLPEGEQLIIDPP